MKTVPLVVPVFLLPSQEEPDGEGGEGGKVLLQASQCAASAVI
ncbi:MAG: hypothetical protein V1809_01485 [Planctomycetota bacterium]